MLREEGDRERHGEVDGAGVDAAAPLEAFVADEPGVGAEEGDVGLAFGEGLQAAVDRVCAADPRAGGDGGGEEEEHTCGEFTEHDLHPMLRL